MFTGLETLTARGVSLERWTLPNLTALLFLMIPLRLLVYHRRFSWGLLFCHPRLMIFSILMAIYLAGSGLPAGDSTPATYLPLSILREGNFNLDEFDFLHKNGVRHYLEFVNGHYVSAFPVGSSIMALAMYIPTAIGGAEIDAVLPKELAKMSAAAIVALSAVLFYGLLRRLTSRRISMLLTVVYALGSSSLSISSRGLWQHGASQLALTAGVYCLVRGRGQPVWIAISGFPLAFSVVCRPSDLVVVLPLILYVIRYHRPQFLKFAIAAFPVAVFQLLYNEIYFGNPFHSQFPLSETFFKTPLLEGFAGILFSPARGLFIYSPVFLLSLLGMGLVWHRNGDRLLRSLTAGVLLSILLYSKWGNWWGGTGQNYGPRFMADITPLLTLFLYSARRLISRNRWLKKIFVLTLLWSIGAHSIGAFWDQGNWNSYMGYRFPESLWSWNESPIALFVRGMAVDPMRIKLQDLPTSQTAPESVMASYRSVPQALVVRPSKPFRFAIIAKNEGSSVWIGHSRGDRLKGRVVLGWSILSEGIIVARGAVPLLRDVFPQDSCTIGDFIVAPDQQGAYVLKAGIVSYQTGKFSDTKNKAILEVLLRVREAKRWRER